MGLVLAAGQVCICINRMDMVDLIWGNHVRRARRTRQLGFWPHGGSAVSPRRAGRVVSVPKQNVRCHQGASAGRPHPIGFGWSSLLLAAHCRHRPPAHPSQQMNSGRCPLPGVEHPSDDGDRGPRAGALRASRGVSPQAYRLWTRADPHSVNLAEAPLTCGRLLLGACRQTL